VYTLYAMDTFFYHSQGVYGFDQRCEILKEIGYDAAYLTLWDDESWDDAKQIPFVQEKYGLDVAAVYVTLDVAKGPDEGNNARIMRLLETMEGCKLVELNVVNANIASPSDPAGDPLAIEWLKRLLAVAAPRRIALALYPHIHCWLERCGDAVRLCRTIDHPLLGMTLPTFHWFAMDNRAIGEVIREAAPFLKSVNLCGSRKVREGHGIGGSDATIEPICDGQLDNFHVLGLLSANGYRGPLGFQGFSIGGDVYGKLARTMEAYRDMEDRLSRHPNWAVLR